MAEQEKKSGMGSKENFEQDQETRRSGSSLDDEDIEQGSNRRSQDRTGSDKSKVDRQQSGGRPQSGRSDQNRNA